jgi:ABC-type transport system substrate-binding protein
MHRFTHSPPQPPTSPLHPAPRTAHPARGRAGTVWGVMGGLMWGLLCLGLGLHAAPVSAQVAAALSARPAALATAPAALKRVRYAFPTAETGFDPAQVSDLYSSTVIAHIFESPLTYDYAERPVRLKPQTAVALPEHSADFRVWTIHLRPGITFADDPAFGGQPRELTAADYAFALKRQFDPRWKSPHYADRHAQGLAGLEALRQRALEQHQPFDYQAPVPELQTPDRYTLRITLGRPDPQFAYLLADPLRFGAMAPEVVARYGDEIMAHPVGTGPFKLSQWRRSSLIVLERNPGFREQRYDSHPTAADATGRALAQQFNGRRLPMVDRLEFAIIEAPQPTWLSFLAQEFDLVMLPLDFAPIVAPNGHLAPNLARQGLQLERVLRADHTYTYFNMLDPVVGGYTAEKIALRRAISLAYDNRAEVNRARRGLGIPATSVMVPHTTGYDPAQDFGFSDHDPARAQALLDLYGYVDRDGDGWRDLPDGRPLVLHLASQSDDSQRQFNELWAKAMAAVHLKLVFDLGVWPDHFKQARAGQLQMWGLGNSAVSPDGANFLAEAYGPQAGSENLPRFALPAYDALVARIQVMEDGPERRALMGQAQALLAVYLPYKPHVHRYRLYLSQPWLRGYRDHPFARDFGRYVDVDPARLPASGRQP